MKKALICGLALATTVTSLFSAELTIADFEKRDPEGWKIPDWAGEKADHVAQEVAISMEQASKGKQSLKVTALFPGKDRWTVAVVETQENLDLSQYSKLLVDIFLPKDAPQGLKGNMCMTYGEQWTWAESLLNVDLVPGKWTTVQVDISEGSQEWEKTQVDNEFRSDIRKIDIRVVSDKKPSYSGEFYIDNLRAE